MSGIPSIDLLQMETNSSSINLLARSKKLPPPPLCLPATNPIIDEDKNQNSNQQYEQKKMKNFSCLSSSSENCPHKYKPYTLPTSKRSQVLEILKASSSILLVPPLLETKHKKSYNAAYINQKNLLKHHQSSSKVTITDAEWIDFMRLVIHKPLEHELKLLLDKYKTTYFDRVNAPNTTDDCVRSSLCTIVSEALNSYSSNSILLQPVTTDDLTINMSSPVSTITNTNSGSSKRKRKNTSTSLSIAPSVNINNQTKFLISQIIPGKYDNNDTKTITLQQKQFHKKCNHLFKYIPNKDEQDYLIHEGYLKNILPNNNNICLMLYDEVVDNMDEYDLELSGISIDNSFILPESILAHIYSSIQ